MDESPASPSTYLIYREQNHSLDDIGLWIKYTLSVTDVAEPEHVDGIQVTDGTLPLLGMEPVRGRLFTRKDDAAQAPHGVAFLWFLAAQVRRRSGGPAFKN